MSQVQPQKQQPALKSTLSSIGNGILRTGSYLYNMKGSIKKSKQYQYCIETQEQLNQQYFVPLQNFYRQLPPTISETKIQVLSDYSFNQRFFAVNVVALLTTVLTLKRFHNVELFSKSLLAIRNTGMSYFIGGLFIAPEIYNPLMKDQ